MHSRLAHSSFISALCSGLIYLCLASPAHAYTRIYIHSDADEAYAANRSAEEPETYYFHPGIHFGGYTKDSSLERTAFIDIARGMAPHLAKQNYRPANSLETCDLLLIVSWGTTNPRRYRDVANDIFGDYNDAGYYDRVARGEYDASDYRWYGKQRNSKLLGFFPYIRRDKFTGISPQEEYELRAAMKSERYFIIVTAFDFQELRQNKTWKRVWSTRFNIRSPGTHFAEAHLALSKAGAPYYGKNLKDLAHTRADLAPVAVEVEIGDIEVLETIDAPRGPGMLNALRVDEERD